MKVCEVEISGLFGSEYGCNASRCRDKHVHNIGFDHSDLISDVCGVFSGSCDDLCREGIRVEAEILSQTGLIWSASSAVGVKMRILGDPYTFLFEVFGDNSMR